MKAKAAIVSCALFGIMAWANTPGEPVPTAPTCKVELYGDSLFLPHKARNGDVLDFAKKLGEELPFTRIFNVSVEHLSLDDAVRGYTATGTSQGSLVMPPFVHRVKDANVVVMALGSVDATLNKTPNAFGENLQTVISSAKNNGQHLILVGTHPAELRPESVKTAQLFDRIIQQKATQAKVPYVKAYYPPKDVHLIGIELKKAIAVACNQQ